MRILPALLVGLATVAPPTAGYGEPATQARVERAVLDAVRARMGPSAAVVVDLLETSLRPGWSGALTARPSPAARLGEPVDFQLSATGPDGRAVSVGRARAVLSVTVPHARTTRLVPRGTVLAEEDVASVTADPGRVQLRPLPAARDLVGASTRRDLGDGEVVTFQAAPPPPDVRAGAPVQAVVTYGTVRVTAELVAVDSGMAGALVRVVNRDSRRELRARVTGPQMVEVIHGEN